MVFWLWIWLAVNVGFVLGAWWATRPTEPVPPGDYRNN